MALCNVSLQVIPSVTEERIYPVVDKVIEYIASTGVKYEVGATRWLTRDSEEGSRDMYRRRCIKSMFYG